MAPKDGLTRMAVAIQDNNLDDGVTFDRLKNDWKTGFVAGEYFPDRPLATNRAISSLKYSSYSRKIITDQISVHQVCRH
jgi:hypothetical protein